MFKKYFRKIKVFLLLVAVPILFPLHTSLKAGPVPDSIMGYVVIPSFDRLKRNVEAAAPLVYPEALPPNMLDATVGMLLGDPGLVNLKRQNPIAVMAFKPKDEKEQLPVVLYLPVIKDENYKKIFQQRGMKVYSKKGILMAAKTDEALKTGKGHLNFYQKLLKSKISSDLKININLVALTSFYKKSMDQMMLFMQTTLQQKMNSNNPDNEIKKEQMEAGLDILKLYAYGLLSVVKQSTYYEVDLLIQKSALVIETRHLAKDGTALKDFYDINAPAGFKSQSLLSRGAFMSGIIYYEPDKIVRFIERLMDEIIKTDTSMKKLLDSKYMTVFRESAKFWTGETAFNASFDQNSKFGFEYISGIKDSAGYLDYIDRSFAFFKELPAFKDMLEKSALTDFTFKKNTRQFMDVDIHHLYMKFDMEKFPEKDRESFKKMFGEEIVYEMALVNGFLLSSINSSSMEELIRKARSGSSMGTLEAFKNFKSGMDTYIDYDIVHLFSGFLNQDLKMTPEARQEMEMFVNKLKILPDNERILTIGGKNSRGLSLRKYNVPFKIIGEIVRMSMQNKGKGGVEKEGI